MSTIDEDPFAKLIGPLCEEWIRYDDRSRRQIHGHLLAVEPGREEPPAETGGPPS